jgi:hypothetical protein
MWIYLSSQKKPREHLKTSPEFWTSQELDSLIKQTAEVLGSIVRVAEKLVLWVNVEHCLAHKSQWVCVRMAQKCDLHKTPCLAFWEGGTCDRVTQRFIGISLIILP